MDWGDTHSRFLGLVYVGNYNNYINTTCTLGKFGQQLNISCSEMLTYVCSAASSWHLGHHEMFSIQYIIHSPGYCWILDNMDGGQSFSKNQVDVWIEQEVVYI